jgi:DNA-directed RNA polymerase subunit omega
MARITVEDCLTRENNRFALVQLASKRTKQLLQGSSAQITDRKNKAVVTALREIAGGKVRFMTAEEATVYEEQKALEAEAAKAAEAAERERRQELGASLFQNSEESRTAAFLHDALMKTGPVGAAGDDEDDDDDAGE